MFKTLKRVTDGVLTSAYEKVYIVNFEKCPYIPYIDQNVLKSLGNGMSLLEENGFVIQI